MLTTLAHAFMTASRMDGLAHAAPRAAPRAAPNANARAAPAASAPRQPRAHGRNEGRGLVARTLAALRRRVR